MKKKWIIIGVSLLIVIMVTVSVYRQVLAKGPSVSVIVPKMEDISSTIMIPGSVAMENQQTVYFSTEKGELKKVEVKEGQKVKKGDLLLTYENPQLESELEQNNLSKESAYLKINQLKRQKEQLEEKEKQLSKQVGDDRAEEQLNPEFDQIDTDTKLADIELKQVLLKEKQLNEQIQDLKVESKVDGVVLTVSKQGESLAVTGTAEPLIQIGNLGNLLVSGVLSEYDTLKIKKGQSVSFSSDAVEDEKWKGEIVNIHSLPQKTDLSQGNSQAVQYPVTAKLISETDVLKPGFQLFMEIETDKKKALVLPMDAIIDEGERMFVYMVDGKSVKKKEIKPGIISSEKIEVIKGINKNDRVVIDPSDKIEEGMEVTVE
ncbi:efflux RND transporter periplasmic adaptor subunit [Peribacillus sp. NPDC097264]|uniref:efflux RND transporter periplasmic adaptor subunit n=1 Tax=Peribacillus sp. NPDC097264 TaxID=3390616 RepID=UPI003D05FBCD